VGFAFVSGDLWTAHKQLRAQCDLLAAERDELNWKMQQVFEIAIEGVSGNEPF